MTVIGAALAGLFIIVLIGACVAVGCAIGDRLDRGSRGAEDSYRRATRTSTSLNRLLAELSQSEREELIDYIRRGKS